MAKVVKIADFLDQDTETQSKSPVLLVSGEDELLRNVLIESYGKATGLYPSSLERHTVQTGIHVSGIWEEGSLFGARLLVIEIEGKLSKLETLERSLKYTTDPLDKMVLLTDIKHPWTTSGYAGIKESVLEVDCKVPKTKKEKAKLIRVRAKSFKLEIPEDVEKLLSERVENSIEIETCLRTLSLVTRNHPVKLKDAELATREPPEFRDIARAILLCNTIRLAKEISDGDPIPTLSVMHTTLLRLYSWLGDWKDQEDEAIEKLEIPKRMLKDWRASKQKVAQKTVRTLLNHVNEAYQEARLGRGELWKEKLLNSFRILNT
jgi:DNA polymerase III delta subunit